MNGLSENSPTSAVQQAAMKSALETIKKSAASALAMLQPSPKSGEEVEKNLTLLKVAAETEKLEAERDKARHEGKKIDIDASLASKQLRLALLSTITSQLVPLAALLTVGVTFYGSYQQTKQARAAETARIEAEAEKAVAAEAARQRLEWEAFKNSFDQLPADALYKKPTFIVNLKAYGASGKHAADIFDLSRPLLGDLTSKSAFMDVWKNTYSGVTAKNFDNVIFIAKSQRERYFRIGQECGSIGIPPNTIVIDPYWVSLGPCYGGYSRDIVARAFSGQPDLAKKILEMRDQITASNSITLFLSDQIAMYLRTLVGSPAQPLDLSEITFYTSNLDGVDFSKANINQTRFYAVSVKGAIFTSLGSPPSIDFPSTSWWDAAAIDQFLLRHLIATSYPGSAEQQYNPTISSVTEEYFRKQVKRLCTSGAAWCDDGCIRFGKVNLAPPAVCTSK